ncbi:hypothetical protein [Streptomyces sp. NPDC048623]|uniref:hypothetical protein n=1 Tax=Streptomyces sp. NPDC048623 TaxID=3155761 RepID=UPI00342F06F2
MARIDRDEEPEPLERAARIDGHFERARQWQAVEDAGLRHQTEKRSVRDAVGYAALAGSQDDEDRAHTAARWAREPGRTGPAG